MANAKRRKLDPTPVSPYNIAATETTPSYRARVLKRADTFIVVDPFGDVRAAGTGAEGLFHADTRYLSHLLLTVSGRRPLLLSSNVTADNLALVADLTNPDMVETDRLTLAKDTLHILRTKIVDEAVCRETIELKNFNLAPIEIELTLDFGADFADIFEVRGQVRRQRGRHLPAALRDNGAVLRYQGLDGILRETRVEFSVAPDALGATRARYRLSLGPGAGWTLELSVACRAGTPTQSDQGGFARSLDAARARIAAARAERAHVETSNDGFNDWVNRSGSDIQMLVTDRPTGPYPSAGIPWFSTAFGRDGLICALECLWRAPRLAAGTLRFLAATQAKEADAEADAEPGKILHEMREGEMARLGEVPFGRYYGSVDATPLFVMLARAYHDRTGDAGLIAEIWPNIEAALDWMERHGDRDGDRFLEYGRSSRTGLTNQGWKDSADSIFHRDGRLAEPPIALCEVQGYAYAAWLGAAVLARALGHNARANELTAKAIDLRRRFEAAFWCEEIGTYALALDADKRPCRVRSSNAGHALLTGIASPAHAARVAATLLAPDSFSGWGIRTVAAGEARYNPMSYHNGSVWPHDNALIAMGFARYGLVEPLGRLIAGLFDAASFMELKRLPELFCGFGRRAGEGPTGYPVACSPQAWASGAVYALIGAMLELSFNPHTRQIRFTRPILPPFLDELRIENLRLGDGAVDLLFRRHTRDVALNVLRKEGHVEVILVG